MIVRKQVLRMHWLTHHSSWWNHLYSDWMIHMKLIVWASLRLYLGRNFAATQSIQCLLCDSFRQKIYLFLHFDHLTFKLAQIKTTTNHFILSSECSERDWWLANNVLIIYISNVSTFYVIYRANKQFDKKQFDVPFESLSICKYSIGLFT